MVECFVYTETVDSSNLSHPIKNKNLKPFLFYYNIFKTYFFNIITKISMIIFLSEDTAIPFI